MKRVLILDDDVPAAGRLADRLGALGFQAETAPSALDAVEQLQDGDVAVLVAGHRAGGRPGIDIIRLAREVAPETRSLLLGADTTLREYKAALEQGAVDVLTSPYSERDLVRAVRRALECEQGFHGNIHGLSLIDLLQMVHIGRRSLVVRLGPQAVIHVCEGEIVHAVAPPLFGRQALQHLLALRTGSLATSPFEECARTIDTPFEVLLLDVLRELDEARAGLRPPTNDRAPLDVLPTVETTPLPPPLAIHPRRRQRVLVGLAVAVLGALATLALLLFLLAPRNEKRIDEPPPATPSTRPPPQPVTEPLPVEPVPLAAPIEPGPTPKIRVRRPGATPREPVVPRRARPPDARGRARRGDPALP